jgi:hypothetical protein
MFIASQTLKNLSLLFIVFLSFFNLQNLKVSFGGIIFAPVFTLVLPKSPILNLFSVMETRGNINIPLKLLQQHCKSKRDKEILAFAIGMKMLYRSSAMTQVTRRKVASVFHIGSAKAGRLIHTAYESGLFRHDGRILTAVCVKDRIVKYAKNGFMYTSDMCVKFRKQDFQEENFSLKNIVRKIDEVLILQPINYHEERESDSFRCTYKRTPCYAGAPYSSSYRKLGQHAGLSRYSARRVVKRLEAEKKLEVHSFRLTYVLPVCTVESLHDYFKTHHKCSIIVNPNDGTGWMKEPTNYRIIDRDVETMYRHVIWNNERRKAHHEEQIWNDEILPDCNSYWAKFS